MWKRLKRLMGEWGGVLLVAPGVALLVGGMQWAGFWQLWDLQLLDTWYELRPLQGKDYRTVIVGVDEQDIRTLGQWPASDATMAELLTKISAQKPRAIGLDIYRDLEVEPGHEELVKVFKNTPNLIGIKTVGEAERGFQVNPPPVLAELGQVAANDLVLDPDSKVRRGLLFLETRDGEVVESLALRLALMYLEAEKVMPQNSEEHPEYLQLGKTTFFRLGENFGGYVRTYAGGYQIPINFLGPSCKDVQRCPFVMVSVRDVLSGRIPGDLMRDRVVLIGAVAPSLPDVFLTPYDGGFFGAPERTPGVEIHAHLTSQIITAALEGDSLMQVWDDRWEWLWIFAWSTVGAALGWFCPSAQQTALGTLLAVGVCGGGTYGAFLQGWWIPAVPSLVALVASSVTVTGYQVQRERRERDALMNLFGRHVTPKIAAAIWRDRDQLLDAGQVTPLEVTATVLFSDLQGFSTIAETLEPKILISWLNEYFKAMAQLVLDHDGVIDKYIGDAVMAVFGVPIPATTEAEIARDAVAAVNCAISMASKLRNLNQDWETRGLPTVAMRIGIATGKLVAGSLGSEQRSDYTIIGDTVNIASRLESYDKTFTGGICRILISEATYEYIPHQFTSNCIGSVVLKGRQHPTKIYQILVD
ncbi:MAG: adenylate/guanylate cyclase domain-containing protein [Oscillatoriaceae cyanobacterium]